MVGCIYKKLKKPSTLALLYFLTAGPSTFIVAHYEGYLFSAKSIIGPQGCINVQPLIYNFSTIADFIFLNPISIYFLAKFLVCAEQVYYHFGWLKVNSFNKVALITLSGILALYAMYLYYKGFLNSSNYYTPEIIPDTNGGNKISVTGYVVFAFTSLYIWWLAYTLFNVFYYVSRLFAKADELYCSGNNCSTGISYDPHHPDGVAGMRVVTEPIISTFYALALLLVTFTLFFIQDFVIFKIEESIRTFAFVGYIITFIATFVLPIAKIRHAMLHETNKKIKKLHDELEKIKTDNPEFGLGGKLSIKYIEYANNMHTYINSMPRWPINFHQFIAPALSMTVAITNTLLSSVGIEKIMSIFA